MWLQELERPNSAYLLVYDRLHSQETASTSAAAIPQACTQPAPSAAQLQAARRAQPILPLTHLACNAPPPPCCCHACTTHELSVSDSDS